MEHSVEYTDSGPIIRFWIRKYLLKGLLTQFIVIHNFKSKSNITDIYGTLKTFFFQQKYIIYFYFINIMLGISYNILVPIIFWTKCYSGYNWFNRCKLFLIDLDQFYTNICQTKSRQTIACHWTRISQPALVDIIFKEIGLKLFLYPWSRIKF